MDSNARDSNAKSITFQFTVKQGEWLQAEPDKVLLGRNIKYVLNVKLLEGGQVVEGEKYKLTAANQPKGFEMPGLWDTQISTAAGNDFGLFAYPAQSAADHEYMEAQVVLAAEMEGAGEVATSIYKIGRLAKWLPPRVSRNKWGDTYFDLNSEMLGEGGAGISWHWGDMPDFSYMEIGSYGASRVISSDQAKMWIKYAVSKVKLDELGVKVGDTFEVRFHEAIAPRSHYTGLIPISYEVILPDIPPDSL
jgi:hypothetical protein